MAGMSGMSGTSATTNEKILNALNMYNEGLQEILTDTYVQQVTGKDLSTNDFTDEYKAAIDGLSSLSFDIDTLTDTFVQQVTGKDLSTNDFTDDYKAAIDGLSSLSFDIDTLTDTFVQQVSGKDLSTNDFTNDYKAAIDGLSSTYVQQVSGKDLSTNDFTNDYKAAIDGLSSTYVQQVAGKVLSTNDFTNDYKFAIDGLSTIYAKKSDIADVFTYRGSVAGFSALPTDTSVGDVFNLLAGGGVDENGIALKEGDNVAYSGTGWDVLGGSIDTSEFVMKDGTKVLSTNDFTDAYKDAIDGLTDTFVQQVAGKVLSSNDFTNDYKAAIDGLSSTYVQQVAGKVLSSNDFTDDYKAAVEGLSSSSGGVTFTAADKSKLDSLPAISLFMKALLETNDAFEARSLLKVGREDIFDETGSRWNSYGASVTSVKKKFGDNSLSTGDGSLGYIARQAPLVLGGSDFTISFWTYTGATSTAMWPCTLYSNTGSTTTGFGFQVNASNQVRMLWALNGTTVIDTTTSATPTYNANAWQHWEIGYRNSDNKLFFFFNGSQLTKSTVTALATPQYLVYSYVGTNSKATSAPFIGYIDEFFVTNTLLHDAKFTPPTFAYNQDENTIALLHFDDNSVDYFSADAGGRWLNYGATTSSTQAKFGAKSLYTTDGYLKKTLTLGGSDFTVSFWTYTSITSTAMWPCALYTDLGSTTTGFGFMIHENGHARLIWVLNNVIDADSSSAATPAYNANAWQHWEIDYRNSDNTLFFFFNGVLLLSATATALATAIEIPLCCIGVNPKVPARPLQGYIDEFFVTNTLLHDADFTPPTAPFTEDTNTVALLHFDS